MLKLSVIIITWNAEKYVKNCLDSVLESIYDIPYEIIIIDNGSSDNTKNLLSQYGENSNVHLIFKDINLGVSKARNIGLQKAKGEYNWILDIDTIVNKEAFDTMLYFIENNKLCGICGSKQASSEGFVQDSCRKLPSVRYKIYTFLEILFSKVGFLKRFVPRIKQLNESQFYHSQMQQNTPFEVEYIIGANQLIRKKAAEETGPLDENIFYGPEDADYCLRMAMHGWKIFYLPQVSIIHEYQRITNKKLFSKMTFKHVKALIYFFWKHKRI